jgi:hypothetical protein
VLPHDPNVLTDSIRKVNDKGTFVTVVDRIANDRSIYDVYVGGDNPGLGARPRGKNPGARRIHPQGVADHQGQREGLLFQRFTFWSGRN